MYTSILGTRLCGSWIGRRPTDRTLQSGPIALCQPIFLRAEDVFAPSQCLRSTMHPPKVRRRASVDTPPATGGTHHDHFLWPMSYCTIFISFVWSSNVFVTYDINTLLFLSVHLFVLYWEIDTLVPIVLVIRCFALFFIQVATRSSRLQNGRPRW